MREPIDKPRPLPVWKKTVFALVITAACFGALEGGLALCGFQPLVQDRDPYVGFASNLPLFVEDEVAGQTQLRTASNKLSYFNQQRFSKQKGPGTVRVFCLGGSTTFGRPFDDRTSYVNWLRNLLPHADDEKHWEVINAGGVSYASYRLASLMEEMARYSPDLFVIHTGHNEFLEERTYGDLKGGPSAMQRSIAPLTRTRTFTLVDRWMGGASHEPIEAFVLPAEVDPILDHSVGPDDYHRDPKLASQVLQHLEFNLHRMIDIAESVGARVILVTPAANLKDFSPFKSEHFRVLSEAESAEWNQLYAAADRDRRVGELEEALAKLKAAAQIDDGRADLHHRIGLFLFEQGKTAEARRHFQRAIDLDVCPLRASGSIQQLVERTAIARQVPLVDFQSVVDNACRETHGHDCPGREYFVDHVHPTVAGHRLLALTLIQAMSQSSMLHLGQGWSDSAVETVSRRIDASVDTELQARALTNLAQVLSWAGKQQEAGPIAEKAVRLRAQAGLGDDAESLFYAAVNFAVDGNDPEAIALLQRVVILEPEHAEAHWRLASLLYDQQRFQESLDHFQTALRLNPDDAHSRRMIGMALIQLARFEDAVRVLREAIKRQPDDLALRENLELAKSRIGGG